MDLTVDSNQKTVFYIGGFELPDKNAAAHRVIGNGKLLRSFGYEVVFIGVKKEKPINHNNSLKAFGFDYYTRNYPKSIIQWIRMMMNIEDYTKILNKYSNICTVICYDMPSLPLYKLKLYCDKRKIRIISDCAEWYKSPLKGNVFIGIIKRVDTFLRMRFIHFKLDGIIVISEYLYNFYEKKRIKTIKIPPLVDINDKKWKNSFCESNKALEIVYAGGAFSLKDSYVKDRLDIVVSALAHLKKTEGLFFNFNVVGCTIDDFKKFYPNLIINLEVLDKDITFFGKVNHEEAIRLVKKADYSIFLRDENIVTKAGFPTKFVESITCGIPVICNKTSNINDFLEEGKNGFFIDISSFDTICNTMNTALTVSSEKLFKMKKYTYNSQIFDYRKFTIEFNKLFSLLVLAILLSFNYLQYFYFFY